MNLSPHVQFPQIRTAPIDVVRGLREVDPTAELVYMERGRWLLGSVRWNRDLVQQSARILARAIEAASRASKFAPTHQMEQLRRIRGRVQFAVLGSQGFRPITEYVIQGAPNSRIVEDFRRRDWMFKNTTDTELETMLNAASESNKQAAHDDLTDTERARDAWKWMFTRSHSVSRMAPPGQVARSGFTLHKAS